MEVAMLRRQQFINRPIGTSGRSVWLLVAAFLLSMPQVRAAPPSAKLPPFAVVQQLAEQHFAKRLNETTGDLITKSDVEPLVDELEKLGFPVRDKEQGIQVVLAEGHWLVRVLRTREGTTLMSQSRHLPAAYDRLERLSRFAEGREMVLKIVGSGNAALVEWLCTPEAARELELRFANEPACRNFDVQSGHAYTAEQYLEHLRTLHLLAERNLSRPGE